MPWAKSRLRPAGAQGRCYFMPGGGYVGQVTARRGPGLPGLADGPIIRSRRPSGRPFPIIRAAHRRCTGAAGESGGTGRRAGFRFQWVTPVRVRVPPFAPGADSAGGPTIMRRSYPAWQNTRLFRASGSASQSGPTSMQVSIESTGALERRMEVSVPRERVEQAIDERLKRVSRTAKLKGLSSGQGAAEGHPPAVRRTGSPGSADRPRAVELCRGGQPAEAEPGRRPAYRAARYLAGRGPSLPRRLRGAPGGRAQGGRRAGSDATGRRGF